MAYLHKAETWSSPCSPLSTIPLVAMSELLVLKPSQICPLLPQSLLSHPSGLWSYFLCMTLAVCSPPNSSISSLRKIVLKSTHRTWLFSHGRPISGLHIPWHILEVLLLEVVKQKRNLFRCSCSMQVQSYVPNRLWNALSGDMHVCIMYVLCMHSACR